MEKRIDKFWEHNFSLIIFFVIGCFLFLLGRGTMGAHLIFEFILLLIGVLTGISIRHIFHKGRYSYGCFWCYKFKTEKDFLEQIKKDKEEAEKSKRIRCPICNAKVYAVDLEVHKKDCHKSVLKKDL